MSSNIDPGKSGGSSPFKPQNELSSPTPSNSHIPDAPEKLLTSLALYLAIMEKTASRLRELAFIWATVVLLGGFASALKPKDFWFVTAILVVEGARLFGRTRELEWQHQSSGIKLNFFNTRIFYWVIHTVLVFARRIRSLTLKKLWVFVFQNITRLLYWLQIVAAAACVALSLVRLRQQDYGNNGQTNEKSALNVFYGLALAEALMFLSGKFYLTWRIEYGNLVQWVCNECKLYPTEMASLHRFFYEAYSKCIDGSVFDGLKMDLVSFAKELLDSDSLDEQISGAGILQRLLETDRFAADTLRKIGSSTSVIERLIEMLNWKDPKEKKIRRSAAEIVSTLASRKQHALRVAAIPGAMESIASLLHIGEWSTEEEIYIATPWAVELNQLGLLILERMARDHGNSWKIGNARGLLAQIINLTSVGAELLRHDDEKKSRIETVYRALQVVKILVCATGQTGRMLRREISKIVYLVSNVRELLQYGQRHLKLQKLGVELLKSLGMDKKAREKIGATGSMLRLILTMFFRPRQTEEVGAMCNESGEALAVLLLESSTNCERMLRENDVVGRLVAALADPVLKVNASRILRGLCAYSDPEHSVELRAVADAVPMVLKTIMEEKENKTLLEVSIEPEEELLEVSIEDEEEQELLEVSIGLAHQILKLGNPEVLKNGIKKAEIKDEDFAGKLVQILRRYESPESKVPFMRRFVVELATTLMSYEHEYIKLFRDLGMEEVMTQTAKTTSELECFNIFSGSVGLSRHREMLSSLVDKALVLLAGD